VCFLISVQWRYLECLPVWIIYVTEPVVQRFTLLNWLCALFVSDNIEIYCNVPQPRIKFFNISYQSALCGAATWTVPKMDQKCLERFEMWCCRRIAVNSWTDPLKSKDVLQRIAENINILHTIKQKKPNWTRHHSRHYTNKMHTTFS
jgi:hypothetical protein